MSHSPATQPGKTPSQRWLAPLVLGLALVGVGYLAQQSRMARVAELSVPQGAFPEVYVQMDVGSRAESVFRKCLVSDRAGTTQKRADDRLAKASWRCRVVGDASAPVMVADSKNEPSSVLVPMTEVTDLAYPWVYEVARPSAGVPWPAMRWVHFYYERQFRGLYLQIFMPGRAFAGEHGLGRPEVLSVVGDHLVCLDRKLRPVCPTYVLAVADAVFPQPRRSAVSALLEDLLGPSTRSFVLSDNDYSVLEPFPVPVVLETALDLETSFVDQRYRRWAETLETPNPVVAAEVEERARGEVARLRLALERMEPSIEASCAVLGCSTESELERLRGSRAAAWLDTALADAPGVGE